MKQKYRKTLIYNDDSSDDNSYQDFKKTNLKQKNKSNLSNKNTNSNNNSSNNSSYDEKEIPNIIQNNEKLYNIDIFNDDFEINEKETADQTKILNIDNININHEKEILLKGKNIKYNSGKIEDNINVNNNININENTEKKNENIFNDINSHIPAEPIINKIKKIIIDLNITEKTTNFTYMGKTYYIYTPKAQRQKSNIIS